jgi:tRNA threonylcarbamoyladenosine biosynthesis protein TsaB
MIRLVIETATAACSVALLDGDRLLAARHEVVGRGHAERLVPMIGEVMDQAGVARVELIQVDCGPGSFTGIRVGLAAARGFGLAWGVPVAGFSALALIAAQEEGDDAVGVAMTGGHGELFVQRFARAPLRPLSPVVSLPPTAAAAQVVEDVVLGSGAASLVGARGTGEARDRLPVAAEAWRLPQDLAALPPTPLYGRAPDAALPR